MGDTVNEMGLELQKVYPNYFRLTVEKHWEIKIFEQWYQLPDHYWTGIIMVIGGIAGLSKINNKGFKLLSFLTIVAGFSFILDDLDDLLKDAKKLWNKLFGSE